MGRAKTYRKTVCVLSQNKLGEQDLILTCMTKDGSKLQVVAKGARKPTGKLAAPSQSLAVIDGLFASGRSLDILCEGKVISPSPPELRELLPNAAINLIIEITRSLLFEDTYDPYIYMLFMEATKQVLMHASHKAATDTLLAAYIFKLFAHLGWYPKLEKCSACDSSEICAFSPQEGGVLCQTCGETSEDAFFIDIEELALLKAFLSKRFAELAGYSNEEAAQTCLHIACSWAATHGGMRIKAGEYYFSLRQVC